MIKEKILTIGVFTNPNSTNISQSRGFKELGCNVLEYDYRHKLLIHNNNVVHRDNDLIKVINEFKPNITVFSKCNNMHYRVVESANIVGNSVVWYMDAMHNFDNELIEKVKRCNYFICGVEGVLPNAGKYCKNTAFVNQCPDDAVNFDNNNNRKYVDDITFIGSDGTLKIHANRKNFIDLLKKTYTGFKHYNGVYGLEHNKIVNESKINLNFSPTDSSGASVRIYKILASGGFLMSSPWENLKKTFIPDENIVIFNNEIELIEKVNFYLKNEEERERIRVNGYKLVQKYLPKNWAKRIIEIVNQK